MNTADAGTFGLAFIAERAYVPARDLKELGTIAVLVVPRSNIREQVSRSSLQQDIQIDIGILKGSAAASELDGLMDLVEEICDFWFARGVAISGSRAFCVKVANSPIYSSEHLVQMNQFTSLVSLTFRLIGGAS